jgi:mannosyltransferase
VRKHTSVLDRPGAPASVAPHRSEHTPRRPLAVICALTLMAAVLWSWRLADKSLFRDEAFTASTVLRSWDSLLRLTLHHEANGAAHAYLLKAWTTFGSSEAVLRSFSVLCTILTVPIVAAIGWRLVSSRVAVLSAALFILNGSVAAHAQNARAYALAMLLAGAATLLFVADVQRPRRATVAGWVVCCSLLVYANLVGGLIVVCHLASLWFLPEEDRRWRRRIIAAGVVTVATFPLIALIAGHKENQRLGAFDPGAYRDVLFTLSGRAGVIGVVSASVLAFLALRTTVRTWKAGLRSRPAWSQAVVLMWAALPLCMLTLMSPIRPMVIGRYLLFSLPAIAIYAAIGLDGAIKDCERRPNRSGLWLAVVPLVLALAAGVYGLRYWYSDGGEEDWRQSARHVFDRAGPQDRILFANDSVRLFFEYYRPPGDPGSLPEPTFPADEWGDFETGDQTYESFGPGAVQELLDGPRGRVWLIVGHDHVNTESFEDLVDELGTSYSTVERTPFKGGIEVVLLAPRQS